MINIKFMQKKLSLLFIILLIVSFGCNYERESTKKEINLFQKALSTNDVNLCYSIDPRSRKNVDIFFPSFKETYNLRVECFYNIAINTKNSSICYEIESDFYDKEILESIKEDCIKQSNSNR